MRIQLGNNRFDNASHTGGGYVHQAAAVRPEPFICGPVYSVNVSEPLVRSDSWLDLS